MTKLTSDSFEKSRAFIAEQGRDLEKRLLEFHFYGALKSSVIHVLADYQNDDDGFGNALEPDVQMAGSSVYLTTIALRIVRELGASFEEPIAKRAINYLLAEYDLVKSVWPIVRSGVDNAPHAPWWNYEKTPENFGDFLANPKAEIVGYLHEYPGLVPNELTERVTREVMDHIQPEWKNFVTVGVLKSFSQWWRIEKP